MIYFFFCLWVRCLALSQAEPIARLQVRPKRCRRAEHTLELDGSLGSDSDVTVENATDRLRRSAATLRELGLLDSPGLKHLLKNLPGRDRVVGIEVVFLGGHQW